jgi:hypothetical protein
MNQTVVLNESQTCIKVDQSRRRLAVQVAYRITLSEHEHEWTLDEQQAMAEFCLWAYQRLSAVRQCVGDDHLVHQPQESVSDALQKKMQNLMYYLTKEAARTSYREFLEFLEIDDEEYARIKSIWKEKLGVKPYV